MGTQDYSISDIPLPDFDEDEAFACASIESNVVPLRGSKEMPDQQLTSEDVDPVDLFGRFPTPDVPWHLLPKVIRDFAEVRSREIGCDPAGLVLSLLTASAAAIPDHIKVKVQAHNDKWKEAARIWTVLIGAPSTKKTPMLNAATEILRDLDQEMFMEWRADKAAYNALPKDARPGPPPPLRRLVIEDTTIEAAQGILAGSPWGVIVLQDELAGFFGAMEKYGGGGSAHDRTIWLRAYNGGPYVINRKKTEEDGGVLVPNLSVSMLGGIQPDVIKRLTEQSMDDGMTQRFLPILLKPATVGLDEPMPDVTTPFEERVRALRAMDAETLFSFDDDAQNIVREAQVFHSELQAIELVYKQLATHIGKYDGLFARLCLLWHCIEHADLENAPAQISADTTRQVQEFLHGFLLKHAFAFYAGTLDTPEEYDRLRALATYILAHEKTVVKNRDVQSSVRSCRGLKERDIRPLFEQLASLGWLHRMESMRAGSPPHWRVNPRVHTLFKEKAKEEMQRREAVKAIIAEASDMRRAERTNNDR